MGNFEHIRVLGSVLGILCFDSRRVFFLRHGFTNPLSLRYKCPDDTSYRILQCRRLRMKTTSQLFFANFSLMQILSLFCCHRLVFFRLLSSINFFFSFELFTGSRTWGSPSPPCQPSTLGSLPHGFFFPTCT